MRTLLVILSGVATAFAGDDQHNGSPANEPEQRPWAFNAPRAEGYTIDLVSVEPAPGTPLRVGSEVSFKVTVSYSLTVADEGRVYLVFQVDETGRIKRDRPQVRQDVTDSSGTLMLADTLTIPSQGEELYLYVPLVPAGIRETKGQVIVRYPISD